MALRIRLARAGAKKRPFYRIVVADARAPRDGRFVEKIGTYNPLAAKDAESRIVLKSERLAFWMKQGAKPSDRIARFLEADGVIPKRTRQNPEKAKPGKKAQERVAEKAAEKAKAAEAAAAPESPAEETPTEAPAETQAEAPAETPPETEDAPKAEAEAKPDAPEEKADAPEEKSEAPDAPPKDDGAPSS